jgi:hypothetical protein
VKTSDQAYKEGWDAGYNFERHGTPIEPFQCSWRRYYMRQHWLVGVRHGAEAAREQAKQHSTFDQQMLALERLHPWTHP